MLAKERTSAKMFGFISVLVMALALTSCLHSRCKNRVVVGKKTVTGPLLFRKGWVVGGLRFHRKHWARLRELYNHVLSKDRVRVTGIVVRCSVACKTPQCKSGGWFHSYETISAIELVNPR